MKPFPVREGSLVFWKFHEMRGIVFDMPLMETAYQQDAAMAKYCMIKIWWDTGGVGDWSLWHISDAVGHAELIVEVY